MEILTPMSETDNLHNFEVGEVVVVADPTKGELLRYSLEYMSFFIVTKVFAPRTEQGYSYHNGSPYTIRVPQQLILKNSEGNEYDWGGKVDATICWRPQELADHLMGLLEKKREEILRFSDKALEMPEKFKTKQGE